MNTILILLVGFLGSATSLAQLCPAVCASDPLLEFHAGFTNVSAIVDNNFGSQCEAVLQFSDANFLPITYHFNNITCDGLAETSFTVPPEVPNGPGCVVWQCNGPGLVTCNSFAISGGTAVTDIQGIRNGNIGCISETTRILTTLITTTSSSHTITKVVTSTATGVVTSTHHVEQSPKTICAANSGDGSSRCTSDDQTSLTSQAPVFVRPDGVASTSLSAGPGTDSPLSSYPAPTSPATSGVETNSQTVKTASNWPATPSPSASPESKGVKASMPVVASSIATTITLLQTLTSFVPTCTTNIGK
ncbi:hypothetical protein F5Y16DRAFT_415612 [Xylariaceae sp. FL0255]|nr:hypothetical protein F5Y16DRAFT_415612 [Xylariaceae sp. FL0255]